MEPALEGILDELFEKTICLLVLPDIYSVCSTSRLLAAKATQTHFKSFFRCKHDDI
jgi:hypothetical protein